MVFKHAGKAYPDAAIHAYRTRELDIAIVTAPPHHRWVYLVSLDGVRLANPRQIRSLAAQYNIDELRKTPPRKPASAA
jgi:hypothetical protein